MKRILFISLMLLILTACTVSKNNETSVTPESITPNTTSTPEVITATPTEDVFEYTVVNEDIKYYDEKGKRHYAFFDGKFKMTVNIDLPTPLVLDVPKVVEQDGQKFIFLQVMYRPEGATFDDMAALINSWAIYPDDYDDPAFPEIQLNRESGYALSEQNGYFALGNELSDVTPLTEAQKIEKSELKARQADGSLKLVWWE